MAQPAQYDDADTSADFDISPWERAVDTARHGQVAWLSEHRQRKFALLPAELAEAALEALEDAEALRIVAEREHEARIPWGHVQAELRELEAQGK